MSSTRSHQKNERVILEDASLPAKQKRTILTQECLRRLRNTKKELGEEVRVKHLNKFMLKIKNSGFSAKYRTQILDSSLAAYEKMLDDDKSGVKPFYRSRYWNQEERRLNKIERKKNNWYKTGKQEIQYTSVLFVPVTKGGILVKDLTKREEEINRNSKERIKFIESGGVKMKDILVVKNPFPTEKCNMKKCIICKNDMKIQNKIPCISKNVGYRLVCETCEDQGISKVYEGESSRSARTRAAEHRRDFTKGRDDSAMFKHKTNDHGNENIKFRMEITKRFRDPLTRQSNEAVRISERRKNELLNSKSEFNHPPIARITIEGRKTKKYQIRKNQNRDVPTQPSLLTA